jgi:hypothetical protein
MFVETLNASLHHADWFDVRECPHPDPPGISETPAQTEAQARPIIARAIAERTAGAPGET